MPVGDRHIESEESNGSRLAAVVIGVFAALTFVYLLSPVVEYGDGRNTGPTVASLVIEGDLDIDEFADVSWFGDYRTVVVDGSSFDYYPWTRSVVAVPFAVAAEVAGRVGVGDGAAAVVRSDTWEPLFLLVPAVVTTALAAALTALSAWEVVGAVPRRRAIAVAVGLGTGLATGYWSTSSRGMWQHGPASLWLTVALLAAWRLHVGCRPRVWAPALGVGVAAAVATRPTFVIVGAALIVWLVVEHRRSILTALAGSALVVVPVVVVDLVTFGSVAMPYYDLGRARATPPDPFWYGLAGLTVSPSRGALVFMPAAVVLACWGTFISVRRGDGVVLRGALAAAAVVHVLLMARAPEGWWAGNSYGPRLLVDVVPVMAVLAVPAVERCLTGALDRRVLACIVALTAWSVVVQGSGAVVRHSACWNTLGGDLYEVGRSRVWDVRDSQALYGLRWLAAGNSPLSDGCSAGEARHTRR